MLVEGQQLIDDFLSKVREELLAYMDAENRNASGKSRRSLRLENLSNSTGQLVGAEWIEYVFKGRGPGRMPPINKIADWCQEKGLPRGMAYAIALNIAENGTKLWQQKRNIFDEIITEEKIDAFLKSITVLYAAKLNTDIVSLFYTQ